jgi:7,8-dihydropterin-6-yl-methyl-4-(beta-D-ribofuranosyl)aminobenzene 5'-phosphate synthase
MGATPTEQALIVHTRHGVILITGCAHPGIVAIARAARDVDRIRLILGGFHLGGKDDAEIQTIITQLRGLGVEGLAPCHCTGDQAMRRFEEAWGRPTSLPEARSSMFRDRARTLPWN